MPVLALALPKRRITEHKPQLRVGRSRRLRLLALRGPSPGMDV